MSVIFNKREEKKSIIKEKVLTAAREIFLNGDYESSTMRQIAEKAGIGLGTAYNFYKSKEEIFLLAMAEELIGDDSKEALPLLNHESPSDIITAMIFTNVRRMNQYNKKIWRIAMAAIFSGMKSNMAIKELMSADYRFMDKIENRLEDFKKDGRLDENFPTGIAVELIYGTLMMNLMAYIYEEKTTFDDMLGKIESGIRFVLEK